MINLSTTAAAHAYACRPSGSNVVVVNSISPLGGGRRQQRRRVPSAVHPTNGPDTVVNGGLELLGEGFVGINGFRNNRFQYQIPTVGQHYGNAFHLGDDDEEVTEVIGDHHHHPGHVEQDGSTNGDTMYLHDIIGDHINDDDDEEDVEMSTAVEVISIDPNCDYDTEDEDDGEGDEDDEQDDDEEEEGEGCWFAKSGGINMLAPSDGAGSDQVHHNVSLTVDVAHEVIDVGGIRSGIDAMSSPGTVQQGRSRSNSCSSSSSDASNTSSSSSASCNSNFSTKSSKSNISSYPVKQEIKEKEVKKEEEDDDEEAGSYYHQHHQQNHSDGISLEFNPTKSIPCEPPEQLLQVKLESTPPRPQPGRRKRTSSSQRRSFSMPHSPVGVGNGIDGVVGSLIPTSFSFEDLDSLVLSPLKALVGGASTGGPTKENETDLDDSLVEELANDEHFDLAEYITGDDSTTSCDTNGYFSERKRPKADYQQGQQQQQQQAKRTLAHPKSKGKELKVLRQLMLPQKKPTRTQVSAATSLTLNSDEVSAQPSLNGRRSCTAKVLSRMTLGEDSSDSEADHIGDEVTNRRKEPIAGSRKGKRKAADDADPTWNPNASKSLPHVKGDAKVQQHQKLPLTTNTPCVAIAGKPSPAGNREDVGGGKSSPGKSVPTVTTTPAKGVKFGQVVVRKDPSSSSSSSPSSTTPVTKKPPLPGNVHKQTNPTGDGDKNTARPEHPRTNVLRKKTNVKLDHDYCSPKNGALAAAAAGGQTAANGGVGVVGQRKAIEIPFLLPTKDQLRHERKLQKEKKRAEQRAVAKKVAQEQQQQRVAGEATDDKCKDKQTPQHQPAPGSGSSSPSTVQKTAVKISSPTAHQSSLSDVDKPFVKNNPTSNLADCSSDNAVANEVTQSFAKKLSSSSSSSSSGTAPPVVGAGTVKRQVSLLKINQQTSACASSPREPSSDDGNANHVSSSGTAGSTSGLAVVKQDIAATEAGVVRRKLNLQEYKKRREHCEAKPPVDPVFVNGVGGSVIGGKGDVVPKVSSDPRLRPAGSVSAVARNELPKVSSDRTVSVSNGLSTPPAGGTILSQTGATTTTTTTTKQEPLDPISAAKMKALRMQQLKKEAAIKSHEAKLNQKTMPLMPIVPLAQITSLEFDENGNPLSLDEARARKEAADRESLKLHPDFEEIVIVSVGCNTAVTIVPGDLEPTAESLLLRSASNGEGPGSQQLNKPSDKDASLLMNIKDTLKRCCPTGSNMPGSSLIASIQEVMIKKSNTPQTATAAASASEVSVAETAITLKTEPGAGVGGGGGGQEQYLLMHQSSPHLGVSPPSSFSPGKPERAHTVVKQGHAAAIIKSDPSGDGSTTAVATLKSATAHQTPEEATDNATAPPEHGEDKVIMHLRKDRPRPPCTDAAMQTEPSTRFPPLRKLSPVNRVEMASGGRNGGGSSVAVGSRRNERTYRSRRRDGSESSDAESDRRSNRSKSRSGRDQVQQHQHHRSTKDRSRSRHRSSRRRSSRSQSGSRSRSRSNYSHRVHRDEHHHHNSSSGSSSNNGASGHYSRSRRKSRTSSRSSTSSSRRGRRSMSASSSASSASSRSSSSRSRRSRSPRSSSRSRSRSSGLRSATPPNQRYQSRERLNHRRPMSPERKIVYIGRLENNIRKEDLHQKFQPYGKIVKISLHSKDNGVRYGFVTFEKPQQAYSAIDASSNDPNLRDYDVSFGGRRDFCRMQYADLDGELSNDLDHHMPYVTMDGSLVLPRAPIAYGGVPMCHKDSIVGSGGGLGGIGGGGDSFEDLLMQFKKGIGAMKAPRKT